jgi:hypothetical protein
LTVFAYLVPPASPEDSFRVAVAALSLIISLAMIVWNQADS